MASTLTTMLPMILIGLGIGVGASFTGLGGGFLMVPLLLVMGFEAQKAVSTSFLGIFIISISALIAHNKLSGVDWKYGLALGIGGIIGAQIGARLLQNVPTEMFQKIFAGVLLALALYIFFKK